MFNRQKEGEFYVPQEQQRQMTAVPTPDANPDDTGQLGLVALFGTLDLGYVETFSFSRSTEKKALDSRRKAVRQTVKNKTTKVEVSGSFSTYSIKKQEIITLWNGSTEGITGAVSTDSLTFRMEGEEGEPGLRLTIPKAEVEGNDLPGNFADDYMQLGFNYTAVLDEGSAVLAKLELLAAAAAGG